MAMKKEDVDWWKEEQISNEDITESLKNLSSVNYEVDYIITHTCPTLFFSLIENYFVSPNQPIPEYLQKKFVDTKSSIRLNEVENKVKYHKWFFGHLHQDIEIDAKRIMLYNKIYICNEI
jgi:hypothetical protein